MPAMLNRLVFLGILFAAYRTRYDYVYLVWFFIINDAPGRLFSGGEFDAVRIPLYPVAAGISISFQELFLFLYLFKYISMKKKPKFIFKKEFAWFLSFGLFVAAYSFLLGINFDNIIKTFRYFLPWGLIFVLPTYIYNKEILVRCSLLIFPVVFLAFASQLYTYFTGNYLEHYLRAIDFRSLGSFEQGFGIRTYSAVYITLLAIIQAFYFLFNRKGGINQNYLGMVIFIGIFSIFLTGTRGWIIAMSFLLIAAFLIFGFSRNLALWIRIVAVSAIVLLIVGSQFPIVQKQIDATLRRVSTLEALAAGDLTAQGTLARLNVRGPRVLSKFKESPFVGWGFSNHFYDYADGHVGHHNILLNIGILGYLFVNGLFIVLCLKIWRFSKNKAMQQAEGKSPLIYIVGLAVVFLIHSSSTQFWGYTLSMNKILFFAFLFGAVNAVILPTFMKNTTAGYRA
jgi:hypothetical protein